jgi:hypothetical protein
MMRLINNLGREGWLSSDHRRLVFGEYPYMDFDYFVPARRDVSYRETFSAPVWKPDVDEVVSEIKRPQTRASWQVYEWNKASMRPNYHPTEGIYSAGIEVYEEANTRVEFWNGYTPEDPLRSCLEIAPFEEFVEWVVQEVWGTQETETVVSEIDYAKLRRILVDRFDETELRELFFDLDIEYDSLSGEGTRDKAMELIAFCRRRERIGELVEKGKQLRPDTSWSGRKNEQETVTEKRTEDGRITDEGQYPTSWLDFRSKQLQLDTDTDAFVRELRRFCYSNWVHPGWRTASIKRVRFLDGHPTWGEDDVWGVFFHKMTAHDGQLRQLPLTDGAFPQVLFLLSDIGGKYPLLVRIMPNTEDAIPFAENLIARCRKLWDSPDVQSLTSTEHSEITRLVNEMRTNLSEKLDDLKQGQIAIYRRINPKNQTILETVLEEIHQQRMEQGEIQSILDAIRRALKHVQEAGLPVDDPAIRQSLADIYEAVNSDLSFRQQLELSIPVIPFLIEYKVGLDAGVDLGAVWRELVERAKRSPNR